MNRIFISIFALVLLFPTKISLADMVGQPRIIDGDTVEISGERIRLHGIDAPETKQTCINTNGKRWNCGQHSTHFLSNLTNGKSITCKGKTRDRYKRLIAVCYTGGTDINAEMVQNGWAVAYRQYSTDYIVVEDRAKLNKLGLWSGTFTYPWDWRKGKRLKSEVVRSCCKICRKGKACGNSCISASYTCRRGIGCACNAR